MTTVLRYRITAHTSGDIPYDGSAKDWTRALGEYDKLLASIRATGLSVIVEDARPVAARKPKAPIVGTLPAEDELAIPGFLRRDK